MKLWWPLVAVPLGLIGCSADDGVRSDEGAMDLTASEFVPREGLYEQTELQVTDTCGAEPATALQYVTRASKDGYTRVPVNDYGHRPEAYFGYELLGRTGHHKSDQSFPFVDAQLSFKLVSVDAWADETSFIRTDASAYSCEGAGCTEEPAASVYGTISEPLPCSTSRVSRYTLVKCGHYPFRLRGEGFTSVWVTGTFNNWAATPETGALVMSDKGAGEWSLDAALPSTDGGRHEYKFIVNGESYWRTDDYNPLTTSDGVGSHNSVLFCD